MDKEESLRKRFRYDPEERLERITSTHGAGSPEGKIAREILIERRRELSRSARIIAWAAVVTAFATFAAALAAWTAIYFQYAHTARTEAVSVTPTPSPSAE
jgi:hypothetical protein